MAFTGQDKANAFAANITNPFISPPTPSKGRSISANRHDSLPAPARTASADGVPGLSDAFGSMSVGGGGGAIKGLGTVDGDTSFRKETESRRNLDRFVPSRPASLHHHSGSSTTLPTLAIDSSFSGNSSSIDNTTAAELSALSESMGLPSSNRRILSFKAAPPKASHAVSHIDAQRNYLLASNASASRGTATTGPGAAGVKKRTPPYVPDKVLDAPGFLDDYYLNLIDWSSENKVAIALGDIAYVWNAQDGSVTGMGEGTDDNNSITAVSWSADGAYLALGRDSGDVEIWDVEEGKRMRTMGGHNARIPSLSWNGHVLSSGCKDGSIWHHDVRVSKHKVMELQGHTAEVCGLTWRSDGGFLASGGNDNVVNCWDGRTTGTVFSSEDGVPKGTAKWTKRNHTAAVKALAWCPWQSSLLATGGGSADQTIHFWSSSTGARTNSLKVHSQVTSLQWSPHSKELLSTHGFPDNTICLWSYPSLQKIYDVPAHDARVLCSALSPDGTTVATGAGDENLKFWKIWEVPSSHGRKKEGGGEGEGRKLAAGLR